MFSSRLLLQLGVLALSAVGAILYAYGRQRGAIRLPRIVGAVIATYALANILFIAFLWANHMAFPLNLEAMELTMLEHLKRVMSGLPLYVEPTADFVALAYNPLYYYIAAPFAKILGTNLLALRLVAVLGMLGSEVIIFLALHRATRSYWWALIGVGLFAAAYRVMDTYLDNAHSDSWLLFLILLACFLIELNRSRIVNLLGIFLAVTAFWFKQSGALFFVGLLLFLTWREGWRRSWPYWLLAMALGPALYLLMPSTLMGPDFHYFTWQVPRQWIDFSPGTIFRFARFIAVSYLLLAAAGIVAAAFSLWRARSQTSVWFFMLPIALLNGMVGALDTESNNNVFIPMGTWFIITGVLGLRLLTERFVKVERWGVYVFAIGASFALLVYNPLSVVVPSQADQAYQDMVDYLKSLDGPVYAPWIGQLSDGYQFHPAVHWVPMTDLIRGPTVDLRNHPNTRRLLEPVLNREGKAYLLLNAPLEDDGAIAFLGEEYELDTDLGERFVSLATLPKRYSLGWPRYLYRYATQ